MPDEAARWYDMVDHRLHVLENKKPKAMAGEGTHPWFAQNFAFGDGFVGYMQAGSSGTAVEGDIGVVPAVNGLWLVELRITLGADVEGTSAPSAPNGNNHARIIYSLTAMPFMPGDWAYTPVYWEAQSSGGGGTSWVCNRTLTAFAPGGPMHPITANVDSIGYDIYDGVLSGVLLIPVLMGSG